MGLREMWGEWGGEQVRGRTVGEVGPLREWEDAPGPGLCAEF